MSTILTKALAIALVSILMVVMVAPQPAYAQGGLLSGITGILSGTEWRDGGPTKLHQQRNEADSSKHQCRFFRGSEHSQHACGTSSNRLFGRSPKSTGFGGSCNN